MPLCLICERMQIWTLFLIVFLYSGVFGVDEQCIHHKTLPDTHDRSENNTGHVTNPLCDKYPDGWYRFSSGEISTSCVSIDHCGTSNTVWMRDSIPETGETEEKEFCVNGRQSTAGTCCLYTFRVNVTNCGGLLVYNFHQVDLLCPVGYCTADLKRCPTGHTSPTGFQPCTLSTVPPSTSGQAAINRSVKTTPSQTIPVHTSTPSTTSPSTTPPASTDFPGLMPPSLGSPKYVREEFQFYQTCQINYTGSEGSAIFRVKWFFDGVESTKSQIVRTYNTTEAQIDSTDWRHNVGKKLTCRVEGGYYNMSMNGTAITWSKPLSSNEYLGGITIQPEHVTVTEGEMATFTLTSNLPTICTRDPSGGFAPCKMDLELMFKGGRLEDLRGHGGCSVRMRADKWDETSHQTVVNVTIATTKSQRIFPSVYDIRYDVISDSLGHNIWHLYVSQPARLTVNPSAKRSMESLARKVEDSSAATWRCTCSDMGHVCDPGLVVPKVNFNPSGLIQPGVIG